MVMTDIMGRAGTVLKYILCSSLLILNLGNQLKAYEAAPPPLVCDDQINVSFGEDCEALITPDLLLEGTIDPAITFTVLISGVTGSTITTPGNYVVTVTDGINSCWGNVLVEDKLAPTVTCEGMSTPVELPFLCGDLSLTDLSQPTVVTACSGVQSITFNDSFTDGGCNASSLVRTWIVTGVNGQVGTCNSNYFTSTLDVLTSPDVFCPESEVILPCGADTSPEAVYEHFYKLCILTLHNAAEVIANPEDYPAEVAVCVIAGINQAYPYYHNGTSTIALNGNKCQTYTTYEDITIPICDAGAGCSENNKVIREWTIYDWCQTGSDPRICRQTLKSLDTMPPSIEVFDFSASVDPWGCTGTVVFPKPNHLNDDCSSFVDYNITTTTTTAGGTMGGGTTGSGSGSGTGGTPPIVISDPALAGVVIKFDPDLGYIATNVPIGTYSFYYNAFDCCGNTTVEEVLVTVVDATPPVAITKRDIVVSLIPNPGNTSEPGITKIFATNIDNGSFDGCGDVKLEIRKDIDGCNILGNLTYNNDGHANDDSLDMDEGKFIQFCCNDLAEFGVDEDGDGAIDYARFKVWLRVWDDGNGDGFFGNSGDNYSEVWSWVRLEDKSRPTIVCPGHVEIDCDGDVGDMSLMGRANAYNSCGEMPTGHKDIDVSLSNCSSGTVTRQWFIVGNENINCLQTITKLGSTPTSINPIFPRDTIINCGETLVDDVPTWTAGPCDQIAYNVDRDTFFFQEGACFKVLNYWTVINWCTYQPDSVNTGGIWSDVQVVKIFDESAPVIECPTEIVVASVMGGDCTGPVMLTSSATDSGLCASNLLRWEVQVDLYSDWHIDHIFSTNADPSGPFYIPPSASGEQIKITVPEGDSGEHRVAWKVSDGCGNNSTCTTFFTVADNVPPTPYCVNLSTALMESGSVELWACDFDLGAFDNCTDQLDLRFTFTDVAPELDPKYNDLAKCSAESFSCDDIVNPAGTIVPVNVYVWDEAGNSDFCTVFLTLVDNNGNCPDGSGSISISGNVSTENGHMIEEVEMVLVSNQPQYPIGSMTDDAGTYIFNGNTVNYDYEVEGTKVDDYLNGVSTLDLVIIQRHILNIEELDSPYKMIAADINGDKEINGIDLVELRKLILGIYSELPQNDSWRFLNESTPMDNVYPWPLDEIRTLLNVDNNMFNENFIGVKIGDVNGDVIANAVQENTALNSSNRLELDYEDVAFKAGEKVSMTLTGTELKELSGLQFTMEMRDLEILNITSQDLAIDEKNYSVISEDELTFSWNSLESIDASELFTIEFLAKADGQLSNNLTLSSSITTAEAYVGSQLSIIPITLIGQDNSEQEFALYQNTPNPFNGVTSVSFNLPVESEVQITVTDVAGKLIYSQQGTYSAGMNVTEFNTADWKVSGVLYYTIETDSNSATKKMIVLK